MRTRTHTNARMRTRTHPYAERNKSKFPSRLFLFKLTCSDLSWTHFVFLNFPSGRCWEVIHVRLLHTRLSSTSTRFVVAALENDLTTKAVSLQIREIFILQFATFQPSCPNMVSRLHCSHLLTAILKQPMIWAGSREKGHTNSPHHVVYRPLEVNDFSGMINVPSCVNFVINYTNLKTTSPEQSVVYISVRKQGI